MYFRIPRILHSVKIKVNETYFTTSQMMNHLYNLIRLITYSNAWI